MLVLFLLYFGDEGDKILIIYDCVLKFWRILKVIGGLIFFKNFKEIIL